jgi:hypothetical protein
MTPADLATLSLLDPDQGVCPNRHPCRLSTSVGERACDQGEFRGLALICWEITSNDIDAAEQAGANPNLLRWSRSFLASR